MAFVSRSYRPVMLVAAMLWAATTTSIRAQIADADLRKAAEKIAAMQREARYHQERGRGVEALRLREEAQKVWSETVGRIATSIEGKRRAEEAMSNIAKDERALAAARELQAGVDAWKSGKAAGGWISQCAEGPAACLLSISKAKTAIEKGFDAASHQVDANVHATTAARAEQIRSSKEAQRKDLENARDDLDRFSDRIDYPNDATSHDHTNAVSVEIHGELGESAAQTRGKIYWDAAAGKNVPTDSSDSTDRAPAPTDDDYDAVTDAAASQGRAAKDSNSTVTHSGKRNDSSEFADAFSKTEAAERSRVKGATRDVESKAKAADAIELPARVPIPPKDAEPKQPVAAGSDPDSSSKADHCKGGSFQCPNGLPWEKCTHPEKNDCPPPEHAAEARDAKARKKGNSQNNGKKP
jgi:hypothetical protein